MHYSTLMIEAYPYLRALEEQVEGSENDDTATPVRRRPWTRRAADSLARLATRADRSAPSSRAPGPGGV